MFRLASYLYLKFFLSFFLIFCLSLFILGCSAILPKEINISKQTLQEKLSEKFPQHKNVLSLYQVSVSNPIINLDAAQNRIKITADAIVRSALFTDVNGQITLSSQIDLSADKTKLILMQPMIDDLKLKTSTQVNAILLPILRATFSQALDEYPIYNIKPEDKTFLGTKIQPTAVVVKDTGIMIKIETQ